MGSDGLWDKMKNTRAVEIVQSTVKEPAMCSKRLVVEALQSGSNDNITCIVVFFG